MAQVLAKLPAIERVVVISYLDPAPQLARLGTAATRASHWREFGRRGRALRPVPLPFNHPLYILYSSGTTGVPKCIVHGAGGTLLQHQKEHLLHTDLKRSDRLFYFTTCGWMMWNWLMSGLATGATLVLYDGSPFHPQPGALWQMAQEERISIFGTSAKYLSSLEKSEFVPVRLGRAHRDAYALVDRLATRARGLRLRLPQHQVRRAARLDLRRHRHRVVLRARLPYPPGAPRRDPVSRTGHGGRHIR